MRLAGVRFTDNRNVMLSVASNGTLRIHRSYAEAPDEVLSAVVRFISPGVGPDERRAAGREVLAYRAADVPPGPQRSEERPQPGDEAALARLAELYRGFNEAHFAGGLPAIPIRVSGRMRTRLGQVCMYRDTGSPYEITISRRHLEQHGWEEAAATLLHEMVHVWQHENGHQIDHGPVFRAKAREVGVPASARRSPTPWRRPSARPERRK